MKTCKSATIDLLKEIKNVCTENGIKYFISGELALLEADDKECKDEFTNGTIAVFARDAKRLTDLLNEGENRKVESLANNSRFPGFYMRYMDTGTTLVNFTETAYTYDTNSIGVNIEFICSHRLNTRKRRVLYKLKQLWVEENRPHYMRKRNEKKTFKEKVIGAMFKLAQHTPLMRTLFDAWLEDGSARTKIRDIATIRGNIVIFEDDSIFAKPAKTKQLGAAFPVVRDTETYVAKYFESGRRIKPLRFDICDLEVPWERLSDALKKNNVPLAKYQADQQDILDWRETVFVPANSKRRRYYAYMFMAGDRVKFYREFSGKKKARVKTLYSEKKYIALSKLLSDYIDKINLYAGHRVGFCFDHEIFRAALSVMMREAYKNSRSKEEFERKCKRIFNIVKNTNFRHFDSVKKVFWGTRSKPKLLKNRKANIMNSVKEEAAAYSAKFEKGKGK